MIHRLKTLLLFGWAGLFCTAAMAAPNIIELEGPSEAPTAQFVQQVLEAAYSQLGHQVRYQKIPHARSFVEANEGRLDGLRARTGNLSETYPNLVQVPFPLYKFEVVLVGDRRRCGACDISQLKRVATVRGFKALEDYLLQNPQPHLNINRITEGTQVREMLRLGKVDAAFVAVLGGNTASLNLDEHYVFQTLTTSYGYHYVHKKHKTLAKALGEQLHTFQQSGLLSDLREQYGMQEPVVDEIQSVNHVSAVSGEWTYFTDSDDATYWQILKQIFAEERVEVTHSVSNWKRAKLMFSNQVADMLVGAYTQEMAGDKIRSELHVGYEMPISAVAKDHKTLTALLSGSRDGTVCYGLGYDFKRLLPNSLTPYEGDYFNDCLTMLEGGRVDMIADYLEYHPKERLQPYVTRQLEEGKPLFVLFHNTSRGRQLRDVFDREFRKLVVANKVEALFPNQMEFTRAKLHLEVRGGWPTKSAEDVQR